MYITLLPSSATGRSVTCDTVFWWILFQQPPEDDQAGNDHLSTDSKEAKLMPSEELKTLQANYLFNCWRHPASLLQRRMPYCS
jgi:hypothetical protein